MKNRYITLLLGISLLVPLCSCGSKTSKVSVEEKWSDVTYIWANDYSTCSATRVWTTDSDRKQQETINSTYEIVTEPKCETKGLGRYTADFENPDFETQIKEVSLPAIEHDYRFDSFVWTDYTAKAKYICSHDTSHVVLYDANMTYEITTLPSCLDGGVKVHTATYDGHSESKTEILSPLDHDWDEPTYKLIEEDRMTAQAVCKRDPSHILEETVDGVYSIVNPATEDAEGLAKYTFSFENAVFETQTVDITLHKLPYGSMPHLSADGKTMVYGLYPQTNVNDKDLCDALNFEAEREDCGWYYYDGNYYAIGYSKPYNQNSDYKFDNGTEIKQYLNYWYKCEPIVWNVMEVNEGIYTLLSSVLLDAHRYDITNNNNYEESSIRDWLNDDFYHKAFYFNDGFIKETDVDNSAETTNSDNNPFVCDNTKDKVFLFSYQDYCHPKYGFDTKPLNASETRYCKTTDYARGNGACISTSGATKYNGHYWTRSPNSGNKNYAAYVRTDGVIHYDNNVSYTYLCARPAITVDLTSK